jgi:hypothetical protein
MMPMYSFVVRLITGKALKGFSFRIVSRVPAVSMSLMETTGLVITLATVGISNDCLMRCSKNG